MKTTIDKMTREALGEEYGLFIWAEGLLHGLTNKLAEKTGELDNGAFSEVAANNTGAARIYYNGTDKIHGKFEGALKDRTNIKTENHINNYLRYCR
ncbi:hypothetical protein LCGC14_1702190 [marine sediment metagenome]|uniref:Uncharacterized protein n=1 Tax=marine sediment metagenome TaxID=412755 RepID=A0A0F9HHB2_9ZZZZ